MIVEIFLLWTFWFWLLVAAEVSLLFVSTVWEKGWLAWASLAVFLAAIQLFGDVNVLAYLWHNPWQVVMGLAIYLMGGGIYVFPKWYLYVTDHKRKYLDLRDHFLAGKGCKDLSKVPDEYLEEWQTEWARSAGDVEFRPLARNHKTRIMDWMILWPFNFLWTLLNDPIRRFFRHVYYQIAEALQRISDKVFADVVNDLERKPPQKPQV